MPQNRPSISFCLARIAILLSLFCSVAFAQDSLLVKDTLQVRDTLQVKDTLQIKDTSDFWVKTQDFSELGFWEKRIMCKGCTLPQCDPFPTVPFGLAAISIGVALWQVSVVNSKVSTANRLYNQMVFSPNQEIYEWSRESYYKKAKEIRRNKRVMNGFYISAAVFGIFGGVSIFLD